MPLYLGEWWAVDEGEVCGPSTCFSLTQDLVTHLNVNLIPSLSILSPGRGGVRGLPWPGREPQMFQRWGRGGSGWQGLHPVAAMDVAWRKQGGVTVMTYTVTAHRHSVLLFLSPSLLFPKFSMIVLYPPVCFRRMVFYIYVTSSFLPLSFYNISLLLPFIHNSYPVPHPLSGSLRARQ